MAAAAAKYWQQAVAKRPKDDAGGTNAYRDDELAYALSHVPMETPRGIKVVVAGAGISGLAFAHEVQSGNVQATELKIYEKNSNVGGTWFENRYPGYDKTALRGRVSS